jgi:hypothetical protein
LCIYFKPNKNSKKKAYEINDPGFESKYNFSEKISFVLSSLGTRFFQSRISETRSNNTRKKIKPKGAVKGWFYDKEKGEVGKCKNPVAVSPALNK